MQRLVDLRVLRLRVRPVAVRVGAVGGAHVDGDLDLALPVGPGAVDLLDEQQPGAEQGEADRHDHDERDRHGEVTAQPDPDFLEYEV